MQWINKNLFESPKNQMKNNRKLATRMETCWRNSSNSYISYLFL